MYFCKKKKLNFQYSKQTSREVLDTFALCLCNCCFLAFTNDHSLLCEWLSHIVMIKENSSLQLCFFFPFIYLCINLLTNIYIILDMLFWKWSDQILNFRKLHFSPADKLKHRGSVSEPEMLVCLIFLF